jgi:hypothetical protein
MGTSLSNQHDDGAWTDAISMLIDEDIFCAWLRNILWRSLRRVNDMPPAAARQVRQGESLLRPMRVSNEVDVVYLPSRDAV